MAKKGKKSRKASRGRNRKKSETSTKKKRTKKDDEDDDSDDDEDDDEDDDGDGEEHGKGGKVSLTDLDDWDDTEEGGSFGEVPDNKYEVKIKSATLNHSKSSGRRQVSWDLEIVSGEYKGRHIFKHDGIDDEQQRSFLRGGLAKLGVEWPKKSKFVATIADLEGTFAAVTVRTKGEYQNCYFDKALDEDAIGNLDDDDDDGDDSDGDDAPKLEKGDRVVAEIDGEDYAGKITKIKKGKATVKFDDGDTQTLNLDDLRAEDEDEDDGDDSDDSDDDDSDDDGDDEEGGGVEVAFSDDDLSTKDKKRIKKLAKKHEFDAEDYESTTDLLVEIAEYCELEGSYSKASKLIKECEEHKADDGDDSDD